jgi:hypothetical protein
MLQIGISNDIECRLKGHASGGFDTVIEVMGPFNIGKLAQDWERDILKYLREHGAIIAKDVGIEKFDGYKESWLRESFPVRSLNELRALVDDVEKQHPRTDERLLPRRDFPSIHIIWSPSYSPT